METPWAPAPLARPFTTDPTVQTYGHGEQLPERGEFFVRYAGQKTFIRAYPVQARQVVASGLGFVRVRTLPERPAQPRERRVRPLRSPARRVR